MVTPYYFGESGKALYGVYHPPISQRPRHQAVLLCYPTGREYYMAHRAFQQLAVLMQKAGLHVFRFDYFGTGDSAGNLSQATAGQWGNDVVAAAEELQHTSGTTNLSVVAMRLGALLAATAPFADNDIRHLVMWDPVIRGRDYVQNLVNESMDLLGAGNSRSKGTPYDMYDVDCGLEELQLSRDLLLYAHHHVHVLQQLYEKPQVFLQIYILLIHLLIFAIHLW